MLSPSLRQTMRQDVQRGQWSLDTRLFWQQALVSSSVALLSHLERTLATGRWDAEVWQCFQAVFPLLTPSVLRTMQQDFVTGQWHPSTEAALDALP